MNDSDIEVYLEIYVKIIANHLFNKHFMGEV